MFRKMMLAGLALGLGFGMTVQSVFAGDRVTVSPHPNIKVAPPADLAAAEIASSLSNFDPEGNSAPKYVTVGFVRNVGGVTAKAGRTATLEAQVKTFDQATKKWTLTWVMKAQMKLPAIKAGESVQLSTDFMNGLDYRLTLSAGDGNPANDVLLLSKMPKKPRI